MSRACAGEMVRVHCRHLSTIPSNPRPNWTSPWHSGQRRGKIAVCFKTYTSFVSFMLLVFGLLEFNQKASILAGLELGESSMCHFVLRMSQSLGRWLLHSIK